MKGITACAECAYYDMKSHKCTRGCTIDPDKAKGDDVRFYADCTLPDAEPVQHGYWIDKPDEYCDLNIIRHCSKCGWNVFKGNPLYDFGHWNYCPACGAKMDGRYEK